MSSDIHCLFVHGVGSAKAGFSSYAQKTMSDALKPRGITVHGEEALWSPVIDPDEAKAMKRVKMTLLQRAVFGAAADATSYGKYRDRILNVMDVAYARLRCDGVHIFAHSLGVLVAVDWLTTRNLVRNATLTSFGCNLELFRVGQSWGVPLQLSQPHHWRNLYFPRDLLGYEISSEVPQVDDIEVTPPLWARIATPLQHVAYWNDARLWGSTIPGGF